MARASRGGKAIKATVRLLKPSVKLVSRTASRLARTALKRTPSILKSAKKAIDAKLKANRKRLSDSEIARELRAWSGMRITVGIHANDGAQLEGTLSIAQIMTVHEFGSEDGTIPQRSWLRAWFDGAGELTSGLIRDLSAQIAKGNLKASTAARRLGAICVGQIQLRWAGSNGWKPVTDETQRRKGAGKTKPLILSGQSRGSVTFQVHDASGKVVASSPAKKG